LSWYKTKLAAQPTSIPTNQPTHCPLLIEQGKVTGVEDFGVIVEWTSADGAKRSGLLHVSEMRAPAAAAEAELAAAGAEEEAEEGEEGGGLLADEGEYAAELYVDVGGIDKPSQYYKVRVFFGGIWVA
jgi:hypothetical protein